jgi:hypothetical protein
LLAALLVIAITTLLALAAVGAALLYFGYLPDTPRQLAEAQSQLATVQAQGQALQLQNSALQTEVAAQGLRGGSDHEALGDLTRQLEELAALREQLRREREQSASQNATLVAEARGSRDAVALFATAEAGRVALLADLDRRSARVERFLQRLSDISGDTAFDLAATPLATPLVPAPASPTSPPLVADTPTPIVEPSPTPTWTSTPTEPPTPTVREITATPRPTRTPTPDADEAPTPTLGR